MVRIGKRWLRIGIRREEKNRWETRAPLTPLHAKDLKKLPDVEVVVQPCNKRIFTNQEYQEVIFFNILMFSPTCRIGWSKDGGGLDVM